MALGLLFRLALLGVMVWVAYRVVSNIAGSPFTRRSAFKCASCRHCGRTFPDGVICRYGTRETFKNAVHISNCLDYEETRGAKRGDT